MLCISWCLFKSQVVRRKELVGVHARLVLFSDCGVCVMLFELVFSAARVKLDVLWVIMKRLMEEGGLQ